MTEIFRAKSATLRNAGELRDAGLIASDRVASLDAVAARYAVAITPEIAGLIDAGNPDDPIARQFIPNEKELVTAPEDMADPIGDDRHSPLAGLVHRYCDRALLKLVSVCPVYCRFCFRREMVGPGEGALSPERFDAARDYIAQHAEISEVILSGGDPFVLPAKRIAEITTALAAIPHVKILRWHTRVPVADPARVSEDLVRALKSAGAATYVAVHANHARELGPAAREACARIIDAGIPMLSQSVLLRGVNDDIATLENLMRAFVENRIKPYYLHHPDFAPGTAHFRLTVARGQELMRGLRARVSGLAAPTYVIDIPGGYSKARAELCEVGADSADLMVRDATGAWHAYPERAEP